MIYCDTQIDPRDTDPFSPIKGQIWFNQTDCVLRYFDGTSVIDLVSATSLDGIPVLPDTPTSPAAGDVWYSEADCGIQVFDGTCVKTITNGISPTYVQSGVEVFVGAFSALSSHKAYGGIKVDGLITVCCDGQIVCD